ncbi:hypothetical protein LX99_00634 [Mucilaginibacter oryzae]|uniref:DUF6671 domain-containing protein n=1 Tax=Mucilaginibacter oryzae TaxID=468058 RepID=A0A316HJF5_9SPHI|nr:DUF6671 family protein [Mucilaginibacter oryzae]PWK80170.1 hypothetical protein LX99_00634 [Mucilaginibacter oryzae]
MREFEGRILLIATMHAKEKVMAPLLEKALGARCLVADGLDTDSLGTFSGEKEREDDALTTARKKCLQGMMMYDCDLAVASEGSFGPHPLNPFCYADEEIVLLLDKRNNLEISAVSVSVDTNFNGGFVDSLPQLLDFAERAKFPSHGLILRKSKDDLQTITKGIRDPAQLANEFERLQKMYGKVFVQTDMRAMYNPLRMAVIGQATEKLVEKIKSRCTVCNTPGFGVTSARAGLPCRLCGLPTRSSLAYLYQCSNCGFEHEQLYPNQLQFEDPAYCDYCNP